jgi:hypothetical protein
MEAAQISNFTFDPFDRAYEKQFQNSGKKKLIDEGFPSARCSKRSMNSLFDVPLVLSRASYRKYIHITMEWVD